MEQDLTSRSRLPLFLLGAAAFIGLSGAVFYGWVQQGSSIFLTLVENGLSWCM
ncbi:hypothetical protein [Rhizobium sp. LCM 4573]|uniref:hypothetical protein n=1 Tax=Rhizobium sp. LCM 4573 TaxID=1848291 RepID=UPI0018E34203|nr:hypothetical protein [Rhizobium sp. LCM 4573]